MGLTFTVKNSAKQTQLECFKVPVLEIYCLALERK